VRARAELYIYLPAYNKVRRVASHATKGGFLGTTYSNEDISTITFGDPLVAAEGENARAFAIRLQATVAALGDEATSDWWQARRRAHAGTSPGLTGPDVGAWRRAWALGDRDRRSRRKRRRWPEL